MRSKTTLPISEARKKIFKIADEVQKPATYYTLTEKGRPKVVMLSAEEFESWLETLDIMVNPRLMKDIKSARREFQKGEYVSLEEVLREEGFLIQASPKKYVSGRSKKNRKKEPKKNPKKT